MKNHNGICFFVFVILFTLFGVDILAVYMQFNKQSQVAIPFGLYREISGY